MLTSRGSQLLKTVKLLSRNNGKIPQLVRNSHDAAWAYRKAPDPAPKYIEYTADFVGGFAWWWVLWHIWTEPGHITGEFPWPDSSQWTDEELGIPSE